VSARATINYAAHTDYRPRYFANDHSRDTVVIDSVVMPLANGRNAVPTLAAEGFVLVPHASIITDFTDAAAVSQDHPPEIMDLLQQQTGADLVIVTAPGVLRFSEKSPRAGTLNNSMPARFAHIDITPQTAAEFARASLPAGQTCSRYAHFNVWRSFSGPPQDVGLAVCDARSVAASDLIEADAIFDAPGKPEWGFAGHVVAHNPQHRWVSFPDMTPQEVLIFKTSDSAGGHAVPHVAFDTADAPATCHPRASIEMRAVAYWYP
jgi:hypothetical protein